MKLLNQDCSCGGPKCLSSEGTCIINVHKRTCKKIFEVNRLRMLSFGELKRLSAALVFGLAMLMCAWTIFVINYLANHYFYIGDGDFVNVKTIRQKFCITYKDSIVACSLQGVDCDISPSTSTGAMQSVSTTKLQVLCSEQTPPARLTRTRVIFHWPLFACKHRLQLDLAGHSEHPGLATSTQPQTSLTLATFCRVHGETIKSPCISDSYSTVQTLVPPRGRLDSVLGCRLITLDESSTLVHGRFEDTCLPQRPRREVGSKVGAFWRRCQDHSRTRLSAQWVLERGARLSLF